ncbi:MAG TPA: response regulator transcription factor [Verrucomicrobiae bacterium]|nr:response regulator transcription factor [Verrucomicrobiae bacterium]
MPANKIKVLIVDDHPLLRSGLKQTIESDSRFEMAAETGDGETALKWILEKKPDVVVLDVNLPGLSGLDIARKLQGKHLPIRVIMLTMHKEEDILNHALDLGVKGFVLKENADDEILKALITVAGGEYYLSSSLSGHLVRRRNRAEALAAQKPGLDDLTKAERRILKLIAEKKTSRQIAAELFISQRTVEAHRANISKKLELRGSHSLLHFALENRSQL